jgi:hypothetical protein
VRYERGMRLAVAILVVLLGCGDNEHFFEDAHIIVDGFDSSTTDCLTGICAHNENTDLINFDGAIYLVHRTAESQVLGPNSSLRISRTDDGGTTWQLLAIIPALPDRDLRDPHFYVLPDGNLAIKALTRLPITSARDSFVDTIAMGTTSTDKGHTWSPLEPIGPVTWSFWSILESEGTYYSAAYEDGDKSVALFSSTDGKAWTMGAQIYGVAEDTPLETELVVMPSKKMLALVRMDGTNDELLGFQGRLRTKVCWADPPYAAWDCPQELEGQRLDGPVAFWDGDRLFVVARKHYLEKENRKRTSLFQITGDYATGGSIGIREIGELPSAGDTAYAGIAELGGGEYLVTWYSTNLHQDGPWARAILGPTDIWESILTP